MFLFNVLHMKIIAVFLLEQLPSLHSGAHSFLPDQNLTSESDQSSVDCCKMPSLLGVDRLSAPILSILPIIDIGHFQNIFADNFFFFCYNANKHTIYR